MDLHSRILVVDDDSELRSLITGFLANHGYHVAGAVNVADMRAQLLREAAFDLIILDVMMPGEDGLSAAQSLTDAPDSPAIIMLSALGADTDRIVGLEVGADDYLAKPCNPRELLARVRAVLRRRRGGTRRHMRYEFGGWMLDLGRHSLRDADGIAIHLSDGEFALLQTLVENPGKVLSRDTLLDMVRGNDADVAVFDRAIDSQISRLRRKLNTRTDEALIRTVRNEGYVLVPEVSLR